MAQESKFWAQVRRGLPIYINTTRIEATNPPGIPDVFWNIAGEQRSGWVELKDEELLLRPEQRILQKKWRQQGLNVWTMGQQGGRVFLVSPLVVPLNCRLPTQDSTPGLKGDNCFVPTPRGKGDWERVWRFIIGGNNA